MRKGADCLSKWTGESERMLRLLFDQAYKMRPSIIFFDEIDGLAPVRSSRTAQEYRYEDARTRLRLVLLVLTGGSAQCAHPPQRVRGSSARR